jgi:hypothetical protein
MKIATALLVATLSTAATAAFADETESFMSSFPNMRTYADRYLGAATQPGPRADSSASQELANSVQDEQ